MSSRQPEMRDESKDLFDAPQLLGLSHEPSLAHESRQSQLQSERSHKLAVPEIFGGLALASMGATIGFAASGKFRMIAAPLLAVTGAAVTGLGVFNKFQSDQSSKDAQSLENRIDNMKF